MKLKCLKTGIVYRNPYPNLRSIHAYKPSLVRLPNGEMLATIQMGEAFQAKNLHINLARSTDDGETWNLEGPIFPRDINKSVSYEGRISYINGEVIALLFEHNRARKNKGSFNTETKGYTEIKLILTKSKDGGRTWSEPNVIKAPMSVPYEMCCPVTPLSDGRWIIPTSIWPNWDGSKPYGLKMIALVSYDCGQTWPDYIDVMSDPENNIIYWESKVLEPTNGTLLAAAWGYDHKSECDLPNQYAISHDGGKSFSEPTSTGLTGQTLTPFLLDDGKILSVYRRMDKPGLWANVSRLEDDKWINETELPIWGYESIDCEASGDTLVKDWNKLRFGAPHMVRMKDGIIYGTFWAVEDCVGNIRYFKLKYSF